MRKRLAVEQGGTGWAECPECGARWVAGVDRRSTGNGALVLSNARGVEPRRFYRQVIGYTGGIVALGPVVAWGALVLPWS